MGAEVCLDDNPARLYLQNFALLRTYAFETGVEDGNWFHNNQLITTNWWTTVWVVTTSDGAHVCRFLAEWFSDEVIVVENLEHISSTFARIGLCNVDTSFLLCFGLCPTVACLGQLQAGSTTNRTNKSTVPHTYLCTVQWTQLKTPFNCYGYVVLSPCNCTITTNFHNIHRWCPSSIFCCSIFCAPESLLCGKRNMHTGSQAEKM